MPLLDNVMSIIAPHNCIECGAEGNLLCAWCSPDAFPASPSRCYRCLAESNDYATCKICRKKSALRHVWVVTNYDNVAKRLLHVYKFERARAAVGIISTAMSELQPYLSFNTLIIPVPTASSRIRQRGYDHAALLAKYIATQNDLLWSPAATRLTQHRQVGASRLERRSQLKNAFVVTKPHLIKGVDILLIDDVLTTGATLETCAEVLKKSGAKTINALVFSQKQ